jgi:glc operon protein GlcG
MMPTVVHLAGALFTTELANPGAVCGEPEGLPARSIYSPAPGLDQARDLMQFARPHPALLSQSERERQQSASSTIMYVAATKRLTHQGAKHMVAVAVERAQAAGIAIAVAVADAGGHLMVFERMDGGRFHTVYSATTKAVCAASNKRPTSARGAQAQPLDVAHAIGLALAAGAERWTAMEGGFPVIIEGECIGGVGVSGGDWETDARIAREAVEAIGAAWSV